PDRWMRHPRAGKHLRLGRTIDGLQDPRAVDAPRQIVQALHPAAKRGMLLEQALAHLEILRALARKHEHGPAHDAILRLPSQAGTAACDDACSTCSIEIGRASCREG